MRPPGVREGVWRPDPRDPVDAWLVAAAAVCRSLRQAVEQHYGYHMSAGTPSLTLILALDLALVLNRALALAVTLALALAPAITLTRHRADENSR